MDNYNKALGLAMQMLSQESARTRDRIVKIANLASEMVGQLAPPDQSVKIDTERLTRELEGLVTWTVGSEFILDTDEDHEIWLPPRRNGIEWKFWDRYKRYLLQKSPPLPPAIVDKIDELTDKILERIEDPRRKAPWDRRGMVVGHVQSGKTSNYIGLISKAADAGYRIFIVLAGVTDNLRAQTQMRIDEGFLGYSAAQATTYSEVNKRIGVGLLMTDYRAVANSLTGYKQDFNAHRAQGLNVSPFGNDPVILVVKKNKKILENLLLWLAGYADNDPENPKRKLPLPDVPLLVIDDEADHASINTKAVIRNPGTGKMEDNYDVTAINEKVRQLMNLFSKKAYVGYTATPFANIFIHPEDRTDAGTVGKPPVEIEIPCGEGLFPRSFIINLPLPSNYIGPVTLFGIDPDPESSVSEASEPLPLIYRVTDGEICFPRKHSKDFQPKRLPPSLCRAMRSFILTCATRIVRGTGKEHNSMLIHVTRFINVQSHIRELIHQELKDIQYRLKYGDGASSHRILDEFKELWETEFVPTTKTIMECVHDPLITKVDWKDIRSVLNAAAQKITVKRISGGSEDILDYQISPEGQSVIVIGGDKLSRGLTLEGLSVSYFLRPSRMYDTLMQMGRWFGYRPGYLDVCRLYTTDELTDWYRHIAFASEELRREFETMVELNKTPRDYGLRVRNHPNGLIITSLVKMREAQTLKVSYDGRICETTIFHKDTGVVRRNYNALKHLITKLPVVKPPGPYVWKGIPANLITDFLREYETHPNAPEVNSRLLAHYINRKAERGYITDWTVVLLSIEDGDSERKQDDGTGYPVKMAFRKNKSDESSSKYTIQRLLSPEHEQYGIGKDAIDLALSKTIESWEREEPEERSATRPLRPSGPSLREVRSPKEALLLLYLLNLKDLKLPGADDLPIIGLGISFPGDKRNPIDGVEYEANLIYVGQILDEEEYDNAD